MATLQDIAEAVNLNKTTVSKALRGASDISLHTRERVWKAARDLGYRPRARRGGSARQAIGLICPEVNSCFYANLVTTIDRGLRQLGYTPHILLSSFSGQVEESDLRALARMDMAGAICITERCDSYEAIAHAFGVLSGPVVVLGLDDKSADHDVISVDEESGIAGAVDHLLREGHSRIAFIGEPLTAGRLNAFRAALKQRGAACPEKYVRMRPERNEDCGYLAMNDLLSMPAEDRPTAVVSAYDRIALGAYRAMSEQGLRVPDDLSLTGFDDATFCPWLPVSLSSISCGTEEIGGLAVELLKKRLDDPSSPVRQTVSIHTKFFPRESVGAAPEGRSQAPTK